MSTTSKRRKGTSGTQRITDYIKLTNEDGSEKPTSSSIAQLLVNAPTVWSGICGDILVAHKELCLLNLQYSEKIKKQYLTGLLIDHNTGSILSRRKQDGQLVQLPMDLEAARRELRGDAAAAVKVNAGNEYKAFMAVCRACDGADNTLTSCNDSAKSVSSQKIKLSRRHQYESDVFCAAIADGCCNLST